MTERQKLVDQLVLHEGLRLTPYMDTVGKITIGVGRNLSDRGLSSREVFDLLDHDLDECITDLAGSFPWFTQLDAIRQRVVIDMRFNLGPARFRTFKRVITALGAGDYAKAAGAMRNSLWYQQVKSRGGRLVQMMASGEDYI